MGIRLLLATSYLFPILVSLQSFMALSRIWAAFIIVAILAAIFQCCFIKDNTDIFNRMVVGKSGDTSYTRSADSSSMPAVMLHSLQNGKTYNDGNYKYAKSANGNYITYKEQNGDGIIATAKASVDIAINLIGIMALFLGFMSIAEKAGGIRLLSKIIGPFFSKLFPELPKNHPAMGHMVMNFSANLLGLDNAATPFGIKAMESLQEINPNKDTASNAQIMFLVLHASGLTILPIAIIAQRAIYHSKDPTDIFIPCIVATFVATLAGLIVVSIKQKINLFDKVVLAWLLGITGFIAALIWYFTEYLNKAQISGFSAVFSNIIYLGIPVIFILYFSAR